MSEKIRVRIQGTETVSYNQIVNMTQEEFDEYKDAPDNQIEGWIDKRDIDSGYGFECDMIEVVKEQGQS